MLHMLIKKTQDETGALKWIVRAKSLQILKIGNVIWQGKEYNRVG